MPRLRRLGPAPLRLVPRRAPLRPLLPPPRESDPHLFDLPRYRTAQRMRRRRTVYDAGPVEIVVDEPVAWGHARRVSQAAGSVLRWVLTAVVFLIMAAWFVVGALAAVATGLVVFVAVPAVVFGGRIVAGVVDDVIG